MPEVSLLRRNRTASARLKNLVFTTVAILALSVAASCKKINVAGSLKELPFDSAKDANGQLFLNKNAFSVILKHDSAVLTVKGVSIIMPDTPVRNGEGVWSLPERSVQTVLHALFVPKKPAVKRILLDPGHGGKDSGAVSNILKLREKELNLRLASALGNELQKMGFEIFYTRRDDRSVPLTQRGNAIEADLFISIHHNAAKNINASGFETFCLFPENASAYPMLRQSIHLARALQHGQSTASGNYGRGVKFARFRVLKDARCPALLIEAGFLSNPVEEKRLNDPSYHAALAKALAQAIRQNVSL